MMTAENTSPRLSLIVPTRQRADYIGHTLNTCIANLEPQCEILVLDNASNDGTKDVISSITDPRIRYMRSENRLSMRDNFEKGIECARGDILCFIGDDDGVFPYSVATALEIFDTHAVDAIAAARAHYSWPDLLSNRRNTALLPRARGLKILNSRAQLKELLLHSDYYRLPCLYHGFVKKSVVERVRQRQGRFFLSSQVDMFSAIALSMENIPFAYSHSPLVINGGSSRSNGAAHFGGGSATEKSLWKAEDDLGFLPGFANYVTVGSLIVESGLRYSRAQGVGSLSTLFHPQHVRMALETELQMRAAAKRLAGDEAKMFEAAGLSMPRHTQPAWRKGAFFNKLWKQFTAFRKSRPIDMTQHHVTTVSGAMQCMLQLLERNETGFLSAPIEQFATALRMSRG